MDIRIDFWITFRKIFERRNKFADLLCNNHSHWKSSTIKIDRYQFHLKKNFQLDKRNCIILILILYLWISVEVGELIIWLRRVPFGTLFLVLTFFERGSPLIYRDPSGIISISSKTGSKITETRSDLFWMSNFYPAGAKIAKFDHLGPLERKVALMKLN